MEACSHTSEIRNTQFWSKQLKLETHFVRLDIRNIRPKIYSADIKIQEYGLDSTDAEQGLVAGSFESSSSFFLVSERLLGSQEY
jgi:hypothetical protein